MRVVERSAYRVVRAGVDCQLSTPFELDKLMAILERNEPYIFWLQPKAGGVGDQIAAVSVNGVLYHLNLRLEKAVFRRIRLSRNFNNVEVLPDGTQKLRIPVRLLQEKRRTSSRHKVRIARARCARSFARCCQYLIMPNFTDHDTPEARGRV